MPDWSSRGLATDGSSGSSRSDRDPAPDAAGAIPPVPAATLSLPVRRWTGIVARSASITACTASRGIRTTITGAQNVARRPVYAGQGVDRAPSHA